MGDEKCPKCGSVLETAVDKRVPVHFGSGHDYDMSAPCIKCQKFYFYTGEKTGQEAPVDPKTKKQID